VRFLSKYRIVIGTLLILVGFSLRMFLYHQYEYWNIFKFLSLLLVAFGGVIYYYQFEELFSKLKKIKKNWVSRIIGIVWIGLLVIAFIYLGKFCNQELWKHYTQSNYIETSGTLLSTKNLGGTRDEKQTFYLVEYYNEEGEKRKAGVIKSYLEFNLEAKISNGTLEIRKFHGSKVKIRYSKKHPSFMTILDFE